KLGNFGSTERIDGTLEKGQRHIGRHCFFISLEGDVEVHGIGVGSLAAHQHLVRRIADKQQLNGGLDVLFEGRRGLGNLLLFVFFVVLFRVLLFVVLFLRADFIFLVVFLFVLLFRLDGIGVEQNLVVVFFEFLGFVL